MTRTVRGFVVVLLAALALFGVVASSAYAALEDAPKPNLGTSQTNPGWGEDAWWREGWGRSAYPQFALNPPGVWDTDNGDGYLVGMIYTVDRTPTFKDPATNYVISGTVVNTNTPNAYYRSSFPVTPGARPNGTNMNNTIDLLGVYFNPPTGSWPPPSGAYSNPIEGQWYLHYSFYSNFRYQNTQWDIPFGVDVTPPSAVESVSVSSGITSAPYNENTWVPTTRGLVKWKPKQYDALSKVGYFQILVDGSPLVPETSATPMQGRAYAGTFLTLPDSYMVENLPPGRHFLSVVAVDKATNQGPEGSSSGQYYESDPDTPTVSWISPVTGTLSSKTIFSVNASDLAGPPTVRFSIDSTVVATLPAPVTAGSTTYSYKPDLTGLSSGSHLLTARVTDHFGRSVDVTKTVAFANTSVSSGFQTSAPGSLVFLSPASSTSNPPGNQWRWDPFDHTKIWGNSLHPDFTLTPGDELAQLVADTDGASVAGMLYDVRRSTELINPLVPGIYFRSARPLDGGPIATHFDATVDLGSVLAYPPSGSWPALEPGAEQPSEGTWYLQYKGFLDNGWAESATNVVKFGIDRTPPSIVENLVASPTTDTAMHDVVSAGSRAHVTWSTKDYDALSGVAYYRVVVDGHNAIPAEGDTQGRVFDLAGRADPAATIENLSAGAHTIKVLAVDRATNEGPAASVVVYSDPDSPSISITAPSGSLIGPRPTVSASASDLGGVKSVVFELDGQQILTRTASPYSGTVDLTAFAGGTHILSATVTDMYGRQVTQNKSVTLDKTPLTISGFSRNYSIFYPIKRDKYKDNLTIAFAVNKSASVAVKIRNSGGNVVRTLSKSVGAGGNSVVWDGKWSADNKAHTGSYSIQVTASDTAGNSAATGTLSTTIRNYEVVKISKNKVKIVSR